MLLLPWRIRLMFLIYNRLHSQYLVRADWTCYFEHMDLRRNILFAKLRNSREFWVSAHPVLQCFANCESVFAILILHWNGLTLLQRGHPWWRLISFWESASRDLRSLLVRNYCASMDFWKVSVMIIFWNPCVYSVSLCNAWWSLGTEVIVDRAQFHQ